jgi:hypothetical protein
MFPDEPTTYRVINLMDALRESMEGSEFRYDLAATNDPRVILITNPVGKRSDVPRLGYVVLPSHKRSRK